MASLNLLGFICYTTSTAAFLFSPTIINQYARRHPVAPEPTVRFNDFAFAIHGAICCVVMYSQFWHRLWRFDGVSTPSSSVTRGIISGSLIGIAIAALIVWTHGGHADDPTSWASIDVVSAHHLLQAFAIIDSLAQIYALSHVKLLITFIKYVPQAWHNYKVKSTVGWAIQTILLDLIGGVLSLVQLIIDSALEADWSGISGNPVKFGLSIVSLFFDIIFILQHYVFYPNQGKDETESGEPRSERAPLLG
jgi:cystinosin